MVCNQTMASFLQGSSHDQKAKQDDSALVFQLLNNLAMELLGICNITQPTHFIQIFYCFTHLQSVFRINNCNNA